MVYLNKMQHGITFTLLSILCMLCVGCSGSTLPKYDPDKGLNDKHKAIINLTVKDDVVRIAKFDENYNNPNVKPIEHTMFGTGHLKNAFYTIDPGIYYISYVKTTVDSYNYSTIYSTTLPGLTAEGRVVYGAFEVKAGDIAFLGVLNSYLTSSRENNEAGLFFVEADLEYAKKQMLKSKKYKPLIDKLHKIQFYPRSSRIYRDKNGKYKLSYD